MWSKWQWVMRIASAVPPKASRAARMRSGSSPGSTMRTRSEPSRRTRKQFSATWPTVSISTSRLMLAARSLPFPRADPRALAFPPHRQVDVVAGGDVDEQHEGAQPQRPARGLFEEDEED